MKSKFYSFSGYKGCFGYLQYELQQERYRACYFKLKGQRMVGGTYLENTKQQTSYRLAFLDVKVLTESSQ